MTDTSPASDPRAALQVVPPSELVVAPTPQDRALALPGGAALVVAAPPLDRDADAVTP